LNSGRDYHAPLTDSVKVYQDFILVKFRAFSADIIK
jgi:hypothetical protein